jgi:hypothetical protein
MGERCSECGAALEGRPSCQDHFHTLLFLEAEIPGGPGEIPHFYAVASYGLQHPSSMGYTEESLLGLRSAVRDVLKGARDLEDIRRQVRYAAGRAGRVTRREGDPVPTWPVRKWSMVVTDVLKRGAGNYARAVEGWARSVIKDTREVTPPQS